MRRRTMRTLALLLSALVACTLALSVHDIDPRGVCGPDALALCPQYLSVRPSRCQA